jgi:peptide/nickel transport system substrate-binding protein
MRRFSILLGLLALVLLPAACAQATTAPTEVAPAATEVQPTTVPTTTTTGAAVDVMGFKPATPGGTLVIGQGQEPDQLYIYGGSMLAASHVQNSLYDGPIEGLSYDYQPVILEKLPKLEEEGSGATLETVTVKAGEKYVDPETQEVVTATQEVADLPQLTVRWTLKPGVTWEDGTPVTADDSVFSQKLACDKDTPASKFTCDRTVSYTKVDDQTVEWKALPGFTDQTYFANYYTPLPRQQTNKDGKRFDQLTAAEVLKDETFTRKPFSYGPFKIEEWQSGDHITLAKNPYYWRKDEGLPFLDKVIHKFIPDSNALLAALTSGDVDIATQDGLDINQFEPLEAAKEAGQITPYYVIGTTWEHIDFDLNPVDQRVPLGACAEIRHAMITGTDRQTMVDQIQKGKSAVQDTYIPKEHWAFPPEGSITTYPYDPAKAKTTLDDMGFTAGTDGYRTASKDITCTITTNIKGDTKEQKIPKGTKLELTLQTTSGNTMREQTTLLFQQNMKDIGVKVNLDYVASNVFFEDGPKGPLFGRRFDLGEFAWLTGVQPPVALYYCTEIPGEDNNWAGQNETGWCNPDYDKAGKKASTTLKRADSLPLYYDAQKLFTDGVPVMPLFARVKVMATAPNVVNFAPNATVNSETWNIETWGFSEGGAPAETEGGAAAATEAATPEPTQ